MGDVSVFDVTSCFHHLKPSETMDSLGRALESIQKRIDSPEFDRLSLTEQRYLFTSVAVMPRG